MSKTDAEPPPRPAEPVAIQAELTAAADALDNASTELYGLIQHAEGHTDEAGEFHRGPSLRYRLKVEAEVIRLYDDALEHERRPPPADIRTAKAEASVRADYPELWAEHETIQAKITALQMWISSRKQSISARQSVLRGERG